MVEYSEDSDRAQHGDFSPELREVLGEAQHRGFVGRADLDVTMSHAAGFGLGFPAPPRRLLDLGSGGGVPGLVLAELWSGSEVWLLEGRLTRVEFLEWAVDRVGRDSVTVLGLRAEEGGLREDLRGGFDMVTARGFGPPATTAECAAPFLREGGSLVVSEPPGGGEGSEPGEGGTGVDGREPRWPKEGLDQLGMIPGRSWSEPFHYQEIEQRELCSDRFPRRVGIPLKRPLF